MHDPETLDLDQSISTLLTEAVQPQHEIHKGSSNRYFKIPELPGYVIRVNRRTLSHHSFSELLKSCTTLVPVNHLIKSEQIKQLTGEDIGQPLLTCQNDVFAILKCPQGVELADYFDKRLKDLGLDPRLSHSERKAIRAQACIDVMQELMALGKADDETNPFIPLYERAYALTCLGYDPDMHLENIFFDKEHGKLNVVHQLSRPLESSWHQEKEVVQKSMDLQLYKASCTFHLDFAPSDGDHQHYDEVYDAFKKYLNLAKEHVLGAHTDAKAPLSLKFSSVNDVKAVALHQPVRVLVETLRQLDTRRTQELAL